MIAISGGIGTEFIYSLSSIRVFKKVVKQEAENKWMISEQTEKEAELSKLSISIYIDNVIATQLIEDKKTELPQIALQFILRLNFLN